MIVFDLECSQGHRFEGWFESRDEWEEQRKKGYVQCPICGDGDIKRLISPVAISKARREEEGAGPQHSGTDSEEARLQDLFFKILDYVDKNFQDVGHLFGHDPGEGG